VDVGWSALPRGIHVDVRVAPSQIVVSALPLTVGEFFEPMMDDFAEEKEEKEGKKKEEDLQNPSHADDRGANANIPTVSSELDAKNTPAVAAIDTTPLEVPLPVFASVTLAGMTVCLPVAPSLVTSEAVGVTIDLQTSVHFRPQHSVAVGMYYVLYVCCMSVYVWNMRASRGRSRVYVCVCVCVNDAYVIYCALFTTHRPECVPRRTALSSAVL
jgi:hypothetical protein